MSTAAATPNPTPSSPSGPTAAPLPLRGPKKKFPLNDLPQLRGDRIGFFTDLFRTWGDVSVFHIGPVPVVFAVGNRSITGTVLQVDGGQHLTPLPRDASLMPADQ